MEQNFNIKRTFLITMIVSLSISALIGIFVFLFGDFSETEARLLLTTLTIGGYSLTGLCCSVLYEKRKFTPLALSGMIISIIGFLYTVSVIWEAIDLDNFTWKALIILIVLAASAAHSCLLLLIKSEKSLVNGALSATIIFISIVALMLVIPVLNEFDDVGEFYFRLLGVFAILDVLGTIVTPILNKVYSIQH